MFRYTEAILLTPIFIFTKSKEEPNAQNLQYPETHQHCKTRLDDEEHAEFMRQLEVYDMNQSEFIREAISGATIRPVVVASVINDELLSAIGKLTAEYARIGNNLNQIAVKAHTLNVLDVQRYDEACRKLDAAVKKITEAVILPRSIK